MEKVKKISFRQKNPTICPVCSFEFNREELFSGGGRLIAGKLNNELRREYEISKKYGVIIPLAYVLTVCPNCLYTAYPRDFDSLVDNEKNRLYDSIQTRKASLNKFFGLIDFNLDRNLALGAASYMLAVDCYQHREKYTAPTFKNAVSSLRAAWLFGDLASECPDQPYKKISAFFYKKAFMYYMKVLDLIQNGGEPADSAGNMGPDTDRNWGYEGILYISAYLTLKVGAVERDLDKRNDYFNISKRYLSRLFGMGKSSKATPSELLDKTRNLYDRINQALEQWSEKSENQQKDA